MDSGFISFDLSGDKRVIKRLRKLGRSGAKKVMTKAARTAMRPVLKAARANAPKGKTGFLRKSIRMKALRRNRRGNIGIRVVTSDDWFKGAQFYGAFQEFGWHAGKRENWMRSRGQWSGVGSEGDTRQFIEGKHFVERAYEQHGERAMRTFMREVLVELDKAEGGM